MLDGAVSAEQMPQAIDGTLKSLDTSLAHLSPEMLKPVSYTHLDVYKRQAWTCISTAKPPTCR